MLGEQIGELKGKLVGQRVLPPDNGAPRMEISFQQAGKLLGIEVTNTLTVVNTARPGGVMYAEGHGIIMSKDGEVVLGAPVGILKLGPGGMGGSVRGVVFFQTQSAKFARLNSLVALIEVEQDANWNAQVKLWEWK